MELHDSEFSVSFEHDLMILLKSNINPQIKHYQNKLKTIIDESRANNKKIIINIWRVDND